MRLQGKCSFPQNMFEENCIRISSMFHIPRSPRSKLFRVSNLRTPPLIQWCIHIHSFLQSMPGLKGKGKAPI